jgi:ABC-type sugar transport system ATPase subunit
VQAGITTILVTHDQEEALSFADMPGGHRPRARWSSTPLQTKSVQQPIHALCRPVHWTGTFPQW